MLEEADQDLCLPLSLTHVALFNSSRSSLAASPESNRRPHPYHRCAEGSQRLSAPFAPHNRAGEKRSRGSGVRPNAAMRGAVSPNLWHARAPRPAHCWPPSTRPPNDRGVRVTPAGQHRPKDRCPRPPARHCHPQPGRGRLPPARLTSRELYGTAYWPRLSWGVVGGVLLITQGASQAGRMRLSDGCITGTGGGSLWPNQALGTRSAWRPQS
jgi:hypothetical protein